MPEGESGRDKLLQIIMSSSRRGCSLNRRQYNRAANDYGAPELFLSVTTPATVDTSSRVEDVRVLANH